MKSVVTFQGFNVLREGVGRLILGGDPQTDLEASTRHYVDSKIALSSSSGGGVTLTGVQSLNSLTGNITLSAGTNITLGGSGSNIIINSSASGSSSSGTVTTVSGTSSYPGLALTVSTPTSTPKFTLSGSYPLGTTSTPGILSVGSGLSVTSGSISVNPFNNIQAPSSVVFDQATYSGTTQYTRWRACNTTPPSGGAIDFYGWCISPDNSTWSTEVYGSDTFTDDTGITSGNQYARARAYSLVLAGSPQISAWVSASGAYTAPVTAGSFSSEYISGLEPSYLGPVSYEISSSQTFSAISSTISFSTGCPNDLVLVIVSNTSATTCSLSAVTGISSWNATSHLGGLWFAWGIQTTPGNYSVTATFNGSVSGNLGVVIISNAATTSPVTLGNFSSATTATPTSTVTTGAANSLVCLLGELNSAGTAESGFTLAQGMTGSSNIFFEYANSVTAASGSVITVTCSQTSAQSEVQAISIAPAYTGAIGGISVDPGTVYVPSVSTTVNVSSPLTYTPGSALSVSTLYYVCLTSAGALSVSSTKPSSYSGTASKDGSGNRYLCAFLTDSSGHVVPFTWTGNQVYYGANTAAAPYLLFNSVGTTAGLYTQSCSSIVPSTSVFMYAMGVASAYAGSTRNFYFGWSGGVVPTATTGFTYYPVSSSTLSLPGNINLPLAANQSFLYYPAGTVTGTTMSLWALGYLDQR